MCVNDTSSTPFPSSLHQAPHCSAFYLTLPALLPTIQLVAKNSAALHHKYLLYLDKARRRWYLFSLSSAHEADTTCWSLQNHKASRVWGAGKMKQIMATALGLGSSAFSSSSAAWDTDSFVSAAWDPSAGLSSSAWLSPSAHLSCLAHYIPAWMEGPLPRSII